MRLRAITALAAAIVGALLFAPAARGAAQPSGYPPTTCAMLAVSTTNPLPGEQISVSGINFLPTADVRLVLRPGGYFLKTVTTNSSGSFSTSVTLPKGVFGTHRIVATTGAPNNSSCPANPFVIIHIQKHGTEGSSASTGGHGTSMTGVDVLLIVVAAAVLIGAGVAFNRSGKRKHAA